MRGYNSTTVKLLNRGMVLRLLLRSGPLSRRAIVRKTALRKSTISYIVGELLEAGLVQELTDRPLGRLGRPGPQEIPLDLDPRGAFAIGVHLGVLGTQIALTDLRAQIIARHGELLSSPPTPTAIVEQVRRIAEELISSTGTDRSRVVGVGVGSIAYVDRASGVVRLAPHLDWHDVPLAAMLEEALRLPVAVEHNVRAMALAEQLFGRLSEPRDFAFLNVGTSIGAALVVNGELVEGHAQFAGQLGHLPVADDGPICACGRRGCLDAFASMQAIIRRGRERGLLPADPSPVRRVHPERPGGAETIVLEAAEEGNAQAIAILDEAAEHLAPVVATMLTLLDPEVVVVCAGATRYDHVLIRALNAALRRRSTVPPLPDRRIVPSSFGRSQGVIGGAAVALARIFDSPAMLTNLFERAVVDGVANS